MGQSDHAFKCSEGTRNTPTPMESLRMVTDAQTHRTQWAAGGVRASGVASVGEFACACNLLASSNLSDCSPGLAVACAKPVNFKDIKDPQQFYPPQIAALGAASPGVSAPPSTNSAETPRWSAGLLHDHTRSSALTAIEPRELSTSIMTCLYLPQPLFPKAHIVHFSREKKVIVRRYPAWHNAAHRPRCR